MKSRSFLLIYLVLLLTGGTSQVLADTDSLPYTPESEIQQTQDYDFESTWPSGQAIFHSSPGSGERGFNFRDQLPESNTEEDHTSSEDHIAADHFRIKPNALYIGISDLIDNSQTPRKLLFPFHSFL